jgi:predicted  nucleic acid-binding Zn-ribbon protein
MQKFKNWLISALLKKDKLVAVPTSWQTEYVKLAGDKVRNNQTIGTLVTEYNKLLQDFFNKCSVKELQEQLADGEVKFKTSMSKQELADLAYKEFRMTIERD